MKDEDGSILIAADSMISDQHNAAVDFDLHKLKVHQSYPLVWAITGLYSRAIGQFSEYLAGHPAASWEELLEDTKERFAKINGEERRIAKLAEVELGPNDLASLLIVGWLDGEPDIVEFDENGASTSYYETPGFHAIGAGAPHAIISRWTLEGFKMPTLPRFERIMRVATRLSPKCDFPLHVLRVSAGAVERLSPEPQQPSV